MRGFAEREYRQRLVRAQSLMAKADLSALLLTTEPEIRYFTGFLTRFWESPTRPWYVVVPQSGDPIAVIPAIGAHLMGQGWVTDVRTWTAPDYVDDGLSLLGDALLEVTGQNGLIGLPDQMESHMRMPLSSFRALGARIGEHRLVGDALTMRQLRLIKSDAEVEKIATACGIASRAFARVPEIALIGKPVSQIFRQFQILCLEEGADWVPYLAGGAGQGGYGDVISLASDDPLQTGDVLMLDTGVIWDGYFADFDRNFAAGKPTDHVVDAYAKLIDAVDAAADIAKAGQRASDLFKAMNDIVAPGSSGSDAGRLGHGLGMQLTEWPSLIRADDTVLEPGMVLTLEPGIDVGAGKLLVHEENIVIREDGAEFLSARASGNMPVLG